MLAADTDQQETELGALQANGAKPGAGRGRDSLLSPCTQPWLGQVMSCWEILAFTPSSATEA